MDELTSRMHDEFAISDPVQRRHDAFAAFQLVSDRVSLTQALDYLNLTADQVRPFVADWNSLSVKQINLISEKSLLN